MGPPVIARLRARKVGQIIRAEGPASHQSKRGTPTMGGLIIILATVVPTLLWAPLTNRFVVVAMLSILWMGCIGFLDDYLKIVQGKSRGLVAKWKLVGQVSFGLLLGLFLVYFPVVPRETIPATATTLPFFKYLVVNFAPWLYVVFVTRGDHGREQRRQPHRRPRRARDRARGDLGGGVRHLRLSVRPGGRHVLPQPLLSAGGRRAGRSSAPRSWARPIGFLWFNAHPAEVFMGDTGSLAIGGALGTVAILLKAEFLLLLIGGVFAAEAVSVILQTGVYKWYKRTRGREYADAHRVFRMAPLHHHFEKLGWAETTVVTRFYILGLFCALVALSTLKVR